MWRQGRRCLIERAFGTRSREKLSPVIITDVLELEEGWGRCGREGDQNWIFRDPVFGRKKIWWWWAAASWQLRSSIFEPPVWDGREKKIATSTFVDALTVSSVSDKILDNLCSSFLLLGKKQKQKKRFFFFSQGSVS